MTASGGSMPQRQPNPDNIAVQLSPAMYSMDGGDTWREGDVADYVLSRLGGVVPPEECDGGAEEDGHACEEWPMCDRCRTEFEAWKAAKGK